MNRLCVDSEKNEQLFAEESWFTYFNSYLLSSGAITQKEYERMVEKISARSSRLKNLRK